MPELKPSWTRVRFGDLAEHITDRVDKPSEAGVERYVGLEHLDSDSLRIRRWGTPDEVESTKLRFKPGDIIFGKRRAYQRKLGVADFEGICSAHAMVLRAKPKRILPDFLPFFMQSDVFMERAQTISVGSLSPTINWRTLADEEFALPPLDEQRRIAHSLAVCLEVEHAHREMNGCITRLIASHIETSLSEFFQGQMGLLGDFAHISYGLTIHQGRRSQEQTLPYLRVANVHRDTIILDDVKMTGTLPGDEKFILSEGDILVVEGHADTSEVGRAAIWRATSGSWLHQNHLIRVRCGSSLLPEFACLILNSSRGRQYFRHHAKSTSGLSTLNSTVVREFSIPVVDLSEQRRVVNTVLVVRKADQVIHERCVQHNQVRAHILRSLES